MRDYFDFTVLSWKDLTNFYFLIFMLAHRYCGVDGIINYPGLQDKQIEFVGLSVACQQWKPARISKTLILDLWPFVFSHTYSYFSE